MFVPTHVLEPKLLLESNFQIPAHKGLRVELRMQLERYLCQGALKQSPHAQVRTVLTAQVAAIEAYDAALR